jgi:integrase
MVVGVQPAGVGPQGHDESPVRIDGELTVLEPKSARSRRTIPLSEPAADVLTRVRDRTTLERSQAAQLWVDSNHVFVTDIGEPCDPRNALRALNAAARQAGLDGIGLHTLRHSAASVMLSERVPLSVVSQILGHSGISITADVYGHIAPDVSRSAVDFLGAALGERPLAPSTPDSSPAGVSAEAP